MDDDITLPISPALADRLDALRRFLETRHLTPVDPAELVRGVIERGLALWEAEACDLAEMAIEEHLAQRMELAGAEA